MKLTPTDRSGRRFTGACDQISIGYGCGVFIQGYFVLRGYNGSHAPQGRVGFPPEPGKKRKYSRNLKRRLYPPLLDVPQGASRNTADSPFDVAWLNHIRVVHATPELGCGLAMADVQRNEWMSPVGRVRCRGITRQVYRVRVVPGEAQARRILVSDKLLVFVCVNLSPAVPGRLVPGHVVTPLARAEEVGRQPLDLCEYIPWLILTVTLGGPLLSPHTLHYSAH
jgi:hypothetical protein